MSGIPEHPRLEYSTSSAVQYSLRSFAPFKWKRAGGLQITLLCLWGEVWQSSTAGVRFCETLISRFQRYAVCSFVTRNDGQVCVERYPSLTMAHSPSKEQNIEATYSSHALVANQ